MACEAVIVAAKRTPIGKAYRGAFNNTTGPTLAATAILAAVEQSAGFDKLSPLAAFSRIPDFIP